MSLSATSYHRAAPLPLHEALARLRLFADNDDEQLEIGDAWDLGKGVWKYGAHTSATYALVWYVQELDQLPFSTGHTAAVYTDTQHYLNRSRC